MKRKCVLLLAGSLLGVVGCTGPVQVPSPVPSSTLSASPLPSLETSDQTASNEVLFPGLLEIAPGGCVTLGGVRTLWPTGTTLVRDPQGADIWLVDPEGKRRWKVGDWIEVGGGQLGPTENRTTGCQGNQQIGINGF